MKIGMAMSGGVDSSTGAALLRRQGHEVHGFFMQLPVPNQEDQVRRVDQIADMLGIPLHLVDMDQVFTDTVIDYFLSTYQDGQTPNPCIRCNREIKFGSLLDIMQEHGMERCATGHYARIATDGDRPVIRRGRDQRKDQSYFLCRIRPERLSRILFPLGELHKKQVYDLAEELGLGGFRQQKESQDVCFLSHCSVAEFLRQHGGPELPGDIVDTRGRVLGTHRGIWKYTIGQRRGLGIPDATPWYVVALDGRHNRVIVGKDEELWRQSIDLCQVEWALARTIPWEGLIQLRSRHQPAPATVTRTPRGWRATFQSPQRAITPGQFAAFYEEDRLVGSGIIAIPPESST